MQLYKEMTVYLVHHWHTCRREYCIERDAREFNWFTLLGFILMGPTEVHAV